MVVTGPWLMAHGQPASMYRRAFSKEKKRKSKSIHRPTTPQGVGLVGIEFDSTSVMDRESTSIDDITNRWQLTRRISGLSLSYLCVCVCVFLTLSTAASTARLLARSRARARGGLGKRKGEEKGKGKREKGRIRRLLIGRKGVWHSVMHSTAVR